MDANANDRSYQELIEKQRRWIYGLPESQHLLPLMKLRMSPREADFLLKLPHLPQTMDELQQITGMEAGELQADLDDMAARGLIMEISGSKGSRYLLHDAFFWFYRMPGYAGRNNQFDREISPLLNKYYREAMARIVHAHTHKGLRTVPVLTGLADVRAVMPYEDVASIIEAGRTACVSTCSCRHRKNLDPDEKSCRHETRTCLHFGLLARYLVKNGLGEEISKQEAFEIAGRCADEGLVHGVSNMKEGVDTICNCCSCCCAFLENSLLLPPSLRRGHQPSRYVAMHDAGKCKACGLCAKRCPMKALTLAEEGNGRKKIVYEQDLCLGCGVCAHKCPTGALLMKKRDTEQKYPANMIELAQSMLRDQGVL